jgi:hypothetical protein
MSTQDEAPLPGAPESGGEAEGDAPKGRVIRRGGAPAPGPTGGAAGTGATAEPPHAMIPARAGRPPVEAVLMRIIATAGIIGISVAIAAIMGSQHSKAWLIGLVTSVVSVVLAAVLWSSQRV